MRLWSWIVASVVTITAGCCGTTVIYRTGTTSLGTGGLSRYEAELALKRARTAYIAGDFDQSVDETRPVLERDAPAQLRYQALKLRALAECQAEEAPPPSAISDRLTSSDRRTVLSICTPPGGRHSM